MSGVSENHYFPELRSYRVPDKNSKQNETKLIKLHVLLIPVLSVTKRKDFWRCLYFKSKKESYSRILGTRETGREDIGFLGHSWEICTQVKKQRLELDTEQWTGFKLGKEYIKTILSPCFFNLYAEYIMRNAGLDEAQAGIKIDGWDINILRHADDTTLMVESEELRVSWWKWRTRVKRMA